MLLLWSLPNGILNKISSCYNCLKCDSCFIVIKMPFTWIKWNEMKWNLMTNISQVCDARSLTIHWNNLEMVYSQTLAVKELYTFCNNVTSKDVKRFTVYHTTSQDREKNRRWSQTYILWSTWRIGPRRLKCAVQISVKTTLLWLCEYISYIWY